jgi:predicted HicB family RNase H-like nuclease|nr:MAG TPA: CopG-like protein [Caudoviricetes sp.]DAR19024.1 MAG TPA: CopG-like protein [Caudoviricetes sp.]
MPAGQVAPNKTRTNITIEKELKSQLEEIAKKEGRSFNNLVINILKEYIKNQ